MTTRQREMDYSRLIREARRYVPHESLPKLRVAVLADASTQQLASLIRLLLGKAGFCPEVWEADFDAIEATIHNPDSPIYREEFDFVWILRTTWGLRERYYATSDRSSLLSELVDSAVGVWETLQSRCKSTIVDANVALPYERPYGHYGSRVGKSFYEVSQAYNRRLVEVARDFPGVRILDVDYLAAYHGRRNWFEDKLWHSAKIPCSLDCLPWLAKEFTDVVKACKGMAVKCVVLDLDNTSWGGILGDDGMDGLRLGDFEDGPAFRFVQHFARELSQRGIILAVCSKNDQDKAMQVFREHPDMVLREEDIAVFVANWETKADNIQFIVETLNIGKDSIVFLDDNPFERNIVRELLPEIITPELPEDPADYIKAISELNLFETASHSELDRDRVKMYQQEARRKEFRRTFDNYEAFLRSLGAVATVSRFDSFAISRVAQLIQRSNQFNLRTARFSEADCRAFMDDRFGALPFYVTLKDKVGDFGIVLVAIAEIDDGVASISEFLMSCRVLKRGVEAVAMNYIFDAMRQRGVGVVRAEYRPTRKNGMVKDFYAGFGFAKIGEDGDGTTRWELKTDEYKVQDVFCAVEIN